MPGMESAAHSSARLVFGRYQVSTHRREVLADGKPLKLGARAYDVLLALIETGGAVVSKDALLARVWPDRVVEENALQVQISALRAAFGAERDLIRTVSGRGYQFTGEIRTLSVSPEERPSRGTDRVEAKSAARRTNLPAPVSPLIGRDDELHDIVALAASHRLITLTGPGGIGKTRLALAAAHALLPEFADGVWLVELAPLSDPGLVAAAATTALGFPAGDVSARRVAQGVGSQRMLLVLDNCEHVVDAAAQLTEVVLRAGSRASIIATSREPLRAEGEQIYPVAPLAVPRREAEELWQFGAVQLFTVRSQGTGAKLPADRELASAVASICRQLDGIPLAIELAAARASTLGVTELAAHLDDRFNLLTSGRRTALRRHQTLRATLDWSFDLLSDTERVILRRVAIFAGAFSLEAAIAVAPGAGLASLDIVDGLASLIEKSLITAESDGVIVRYRLLYTTRIYALEKLDESGERHDLARRHATYYRDLFAQAEAEWERHPTAERLVAYGRRIDNLRAALEWAFSPGGDASTGVALAVASVPVWFEMSWLTECRGWMEKALGVLDVDFDVVSEMVLQCALGYSLMFAQGMNDRARAALTRASELAERNGDLDYQSRALAGLAGICHRLQDFHGAVALGRRAEQAVKVSSDPAVLATADWILGSSLQLLGDYAEALKYAQRTHARTAIPVVRRAHIARLGRDSFISAGATTAIVLWAQGLPDQSTEAARNVLTGAEAGDHPVSLCLALTWCGCIVPLRVGDLRIAQRSTVRLKDHAQSHGLSAYYANSQCFEGQLAAKRGDFVAAEQLLRAGLGNLHRTQSETFYTVFLTGLAEVLMACGQRDESLVAADEALRRTENSNALWWMPEALRVKGEVLLLSEDDTNAAENHFRRSLDLARRQGALSWELRAATSLARLRRDQGRFVDAMTLLKPVYDRFTEGFDTADLKTARALLDTVGMGPRAPPA